MNEERSQSMKKKFKISENMVNFLLIFILGFLVGVTIKTEAKKKITIGFGDYLVSGMKQQFDIMKPVEKPQDTVAPEGNPQPENGAPGQQETNGTQQ